MMQQGECPTARLLAMEEMLALPVRLLGQAAMGLSRLWQQRDEGEEARRLLAEIDGRFTEKFDTVDLPEAKRLLPVLD